MSCHFWPFTGKERKVPARGYAEKSRGHVASFAKASAGQGIFEPALMYSESARVQQGERYRKEIRRYLETVSFGANEATIFSKRGSPRKGSHIGLKRK